MSNPLARYYPHLLAALFIPFFLILAIEPVSRTVWIAEVIPVVVIFAALLLTYRRFAFSHTAYSLMAVWLFWHTVGGHYTFAQVPFPNFADWLGSDRNHFDRIGHFSVGFYAYPMLEFLRRRQLCGRALASWFALFFIMSVAAGYEIIEWWYAALEGGEAGIEFLGSQGDIWDAQKDMLLDTCGALTVIALYHLQHRGRSDR